MIQGVTYVILTSDNLARSRRFFTEQLGLVTEDEMEGFAQFTTREGTPWAIMQAPPGEPAPGYQIYLQVDDVDAAYQAWRGRGVETVTAPHDEPFGRTFAVRDPDGRVLHAYRPAA